MAYNAAAAAVTAHRLGVPLAAAAAALSTFRGLDRRMQHRGLVAATGGGGGGGRVQVIDDYAHHPHRDRRDAAGAAGPPPPGAAALRVPAPTSTPARATCSPSSPPPSAPPTACSCPDIFFVRDSEAEREAVTSADLVGLLRAGGVEAEHVEGFDAAVERLRRDLRGGDLVVTMGAGDVWKVAESLVGPPA